MTSKFHGVPNNLTKSCCPFLLSDVCVLCVLVVVLISFSGTYRGPVSGGMVWEGCAGEGGGLKGQDRIMMRVRVREVIGMW